jgi:EAL domain-containing protein (putative c-di-GMP-specific phosphodiesterase class I)
MSTVAEGVETLAQAETVRKLGCEKAQGYFYSRPLEAADLELWLERAQAPVAS